MPRLTYPNVHITHIADAVGIRLQLLEGDIISCVRLEIPLANGKFLLLQTGDTPDHYRVEVNDKIAP